MKGTYKETRWNVFKHRMGIQPRVVFRYSPYYPPYDNWLAKLLWKFWDINKKK